MNYNRNNIGELIFNQLEKNKESLKKQFLKSKDTIGYFFLDDILPKEFAQLIHEKFPKIDQAVKKKNIREYKYTAYQMDKYDSLLEEVIYAFQDEKVIKLVSGICDLEHVYGDEFLYAGGLSLMKRDSFLNPHLDNSHDKDRNRWRVLNLLYYVTPDWELENGGNLEVWPNGLKNKQITIESKFNRLVVMATHQNSWHSVSKVVKDDVRCCVSNYYFSDTALLVSDEFHITTFRGRSSEKIKDIILQIDNSVRSSLRKLFKKGVRENPHQYKK
ncbi:Rps23 Pro-64 3,4-dihydroxylase Tpa1-like proline 4-hydroxylase [Lutibacter sp. Hel_I_33_5]|uniref:2OG-Fe(II) oxygenase n=1 Tax=Lutibacter sp. Hel_I_33_5 TaxID=1566289 RepID=UPI0011A41333|nr:2OG-Fe(II) oxygenase [Lutibacter sp. Hel_I_33_5]TVZ56912.1 Rps23 Pro-64 3,4-dihydroxylase Tpa1-like proline 4-hydroxylase [Lutibacter sp. Hel_I_33_5]